MERRINGGRVLPKRGEEALEAALRIAREILEAQTFRFQPQNFVQTPSEVLVALCNKADNLDVGIASALREYAGGDLVDVSDRDPLLQAILALAQDYYPSLLLPQGERSAFDTMPFPLRQASLNFNHPAINSLGELFGPDEPLRGLFPEEDPLSSGFPLMSRTGSGSPLNINFFGTTLLMNGERRAWLLGGLSRDNFLRAVELEVIDARRLAEGKEPIVPVTIGLTPLKFPERWKLTTPWGVLRAPNPWEQRWAPQPAATVLEATLPMAVLRFEPQDAPLGDLRQFMKPVADLEASEERLRFALMIASGKDPDIPLALGPIWWLIPNPLQMNSFRMGFPEARSTGSQISRKDSRELRHWFQLVDERYETNLDLAARRLLSALTTRAQPEDGLIDAMVALESLFGTGQGEIGFRLSTAVAWLLESDPQSRDDLQRTVVELYGKRSRIVHGRHLERDVAQASRDKAVRVAVRAFRALFSEFPELISDQERGRTLAVRGLTPPPTS